MPSGPKWVGADQRLAEFNGREFACSISDDVDGGAVGAGLSDSGIAVDGDIGESGVRGDGDFVAVDADGNFGEFAAGFGIDEEHGVFFLVGNDEDAGRFQRRLSRVRGQKREQGEGSDEQRGTQRTCSTSMGLRRLIVNPEKKLCYLRCGAIDCKSESGEEKVFRVGAPSTYGSGLIRLGGVGLASVTHLKGIAVG